VYFFLPSHTKSWGQGLPWTIAIAIAIACLFVCFHASRRVPSHTKSGAQGVPKNICSNSYSYTLAIAYSSSAKKSIFAVYYPSANAFAHLSISAHPFAQFSTQAQMHLRSLVAERKCICTLV
jgi:hypothetical protein